MATIQWRKHKRIDGSISKTATLNWSEGGIRCRKSLGQVSVKDAETFRVVKIAELRTGTPIFSTACLFAELVESYLHWRESEYPDSQYRIEQLVRGHLLKPFGYFAVDQIKPLQVEQYKRDRLKLASEATVAKEVITLKAMMNKAVEWELASYNPIKSVRPPKIRTSKPIHCYEMGELLMLYDQAGTRRHIWQFMVNTGMRRAEALHLKKKDDKGESIIILSEAGATTKSRKWREIPLSPNAREALDHLTEESRTDYVLPLMTGPGLSIAFRQDKKGLDGSLHSLRHTFGTLLAVSGVPIMQLKTLMGHASTTTTEQYLHVADEHLKQAIQGFNV